MLDLCFLLALDYLICFTVLFYGLLKKGKKMVHPFEMIIFNVHLSCRRNSSFLQNLSLLVYL